MDTASTSSVSYQSSGPNILVRLIYFVLVGWWLGLLVSGIAWLLVITVIGLPLGLYLINRLPSIITLRSQGQSWTLENGVMTRTRQQPMLLRALWFVLVGWWASALWMTGAYLALISVIGLPLAFWMYGRVGAVTTLHRS